MKQKQIVRIFVGGARHNWPLQSDLSKLANEIAAWFPKERAERFETALAAGRKGQILRPKNSVEFELVDDQAEFASNIRDALQVYITKIEALKEPHLPFGVPTGAML